MNGETIMTFKGVTFGYGPHLVLNDVSFSIKRGLP